MSIGNGRNPWCPGEGTEGEAKADVNGETYTRNGNQRQATPSTDLEWLLWGRYLERAPKWECVESGSGIAYTSQGHMNIHTWRLAVPGGWLYKVTERDEEHFIVQICFVPEPQR